MDALHPPYLEGPPRHERPTLVRALALTPAMPGPSTCKNGAGVKEGRGLKRRKRRETHPGMRSKAQGTRPAGGCTECEAPASVRPQWPTTRFLFSDRQTLPPPTVFPTHSNRFGDHVSARRAAPSDSPLSACFSPHVPWPTLPPSASVARRRARRKRFYHGSWMGFGQQDLVLGRCFLGHNAL